MKLPNWEMIVSARRHDLDDLDDLDVYMNYFFCHLVKRVFGEGV